GGRVPDDLRALWRTKSIDRLLEEEAKIAYPELLAAWKKRLDAARVEHEAELAALPRISAEIAIEPLSKATLVVRYKLTAPEIDAGLEIGTAPVKLQYASLQYFDTEVAPKQVRIAERSVAAARIGDVLPETFATHARFAWSMTMRSETLGC